MLERAHEKMKEVLFIQGAGDASWDLKLVKSLRLKLGPEYEVRYPPMPNQHEPSFATWKPAIERELDALRGRAIAIGHSVGGTILINVLTEWPRAATLNAIVLIAAPFVGEGGWTTEEIRSESDLGERLPTTVPIFLYHGEDDDIVPVQHVDLYARAIPIAHVRRLAQRDHQLNNDLYEVANDIRALELRTTA